MSLYQPSSRLCVCPTIKKLSSTSFTIPRCTRAARKPNMVWFLFSVELSYGRLCKGWSAIPLECKLFYFLETPSQYVPKFDISMSHWCLPKKRSWRYYLDRNLFCELGDEKGKSLHLVMHHKWSHQTDRELRLLLLCRFVPPGLIRQVLSHCIQSNMDCFFGFLHTVFCLVIGRFPLLFLSGVVPIEFFLQV